MKMGELHYVLAVVTMLVMGLEQSTGSSYCDITEPENPDHVQWRSEVLSDVTTIIKKGTPGEVIVYGENAFPIVRGTNKHDVLIAAGTMGSGRILVASHENYFVRIDDTENPNADFVQLHENIRTWIGNGNSNITIKNINQESDLTGLSNDIVPMWTGENHNVYSDSAQQTIIDFVNGGGSFLHAKCPWGWAQTRRKPISEMPFYKVLSEIGFAYTSGYISIPVGGIPVSGGLHDGGLNLYRTLSGLAQNTAYLSCVQKDLDFMTSYIPEDGMEKHVKPQLTTIFTKYEEEITTAGPSQAKPSISDTTERAFMALAEVCAWNDISGMSKVPNLDRYPGDFSSAPTTVDNIVISKSSLYREQHPTGYYAPAGQAITYSVGDITGKTTGWQLVVGSHHDKLHSKSSISRWPKLTAWFSLTANTGPITVHSIYGGLVYLYGPSNDQSSIVFTISGVVEAPIFDVKDPDTVTNWANRRNAEGLWADVAGQYIMFTLPSSSVIGLTADNLTKAMELWDTVQAYDHGLRTTDPAAKRREWFVADTQPSAGYMHSGYPIVTHMDVVDPNKNNFEFNVDYLLAEGNWGMYHEIGHNMQRGEWTFAGTSQVTTNIFSMYAMYAVSGKRMPWVSEWLTNQLPGIERYLTNSDGVDFEQWKKSAGVALGIYAQLARHFGWDAYRRTFGVYEQMSNEEKPVGDDKEMEMWIRVFSQQTNYNLCPLFDFWGFAIPDELNGELDELGFPPYLPEDEMIQFAPDRVAMILAKYPDTVREDSIPDYEDTFVLEL